MKFINKEPRKTFPIPGWAKNLAGITDQMNRLRDAIRIYNEAILAYSNYEESSQSKF